MDLVLWAAIALGGAAVVGTWLECHYRVQKDVRDFEYCIQDIRALNTYNSYFLAALVVFFGLVMEKGATIVPKSSLLLLALAFVTASASIFFIPLKKPEKGPGSARGLWLYTLLLQQLTVILTVLGVLSALVTVFQLL